jgi:hypothetical protein
MSGLTEMMEYITKYHLSTCKSAKDFTEFALHILLKTAATGRWGRYA